MSAPVAKKFLDKWELEVVQFVERYHSVSGTFPEDDDILEWVNSCQPHWNYNQDELNELKKDRLFRESMRSRGIYLSDELNLKTGQLSPRQMAAAAVMMNILDRRSDAKKLSDMGISAEEWENWRLDKSFSQYLASRAELLIENSQHEAHLALVKSVRTGNISAIKYFNELSGRFAPEQDNNVNVRLMIGRILEVIQKHVKDPGVLGAIATDMSQVAIEVNAMSQNLNSSDTARRPTIRGELL